MPNKFLQSRLFKPTCIFLLALLSLTAGCGKKITEEPVPAGLRVRVNDITFDRGPITSVVKPDEEITISPSIIKPTSRKYKLKKLTWDWTREGNVKDGYGGSTLNLKAPEKPEKIIMSVESTWRKEGDNGSQLVRDTFNRTVYIAPGVSRQPGEPEVNGFEVGHYPDASGKFCFYRDQLVVLKEEYQLFPTPDSDTPAGRIFSGELFEPASPDSEARTVVKNQRVAVEKDGQQYWLPVEAVRNPGTVRRYPELYQEPRWFYPVTERNRDGYVIPGIQWKKFDHDQYVRSRDDANFPRYIPLKLKLLTELDRIRKKLARSGHSINVELISGSRNPSYNLANLDEPDNLKAVYSRHQYGDGLDLIVDGTGNGRMDDLSGDGEIGVKDVRKFAELVKKVRDESEIYGGIGIYDHHDVEGRTQTPYLHVDQRGLEVSWEVTR